MKIGNSKFKVHKGFSLVEVIVAAAVFTLIALSVYQGFISTNSLIAASRDKIAATDLMNGEFELIRNMPFTNVGLVGGIPSGLLSPTATVVKDGRTFNITRTIRNVDDPFDGTIGGSPNDLSPADYKMVQISIACADCKNPLSLSAVSNIAPKNLETASDNGALFVRVFDANGQPVPQATVQVANPALGIDINETTNNEGLLAIVDVPPALNSYRISVTKEGFTSERTYGPTTENPNPTKPDATVLLQQLTQISFLIDKVSTLKVFSKNLQCAPAPDVEFKISGTKLIGSEPDILKFSTDHVTDGQGSATINDLEWDTYSLTLAPGFAAESMSSSSPFLILPDSSLGLDIVMAPLSSNNLRVSVIQGPGEPLPGALLTLFSGEEAVAALSADFECLPPGQAIFSSVADGDYTLQVEKSGFATQVLPVTLSGELWQELEVLMLPG